MITEKTQVLKKYITLIFILYFSCICFWFLLYLFLIYKKKRKKNNFSRAQIWSHHPRQFGKHSNIFVGLSSSQCINYQKKVSVDSYKFQLKKWNQLILQCGPTLGFVRPNDTTQPRSHLKTKKEKPTSKWVPNTAVTCHRHIYFYSPTKYKPIATLIFSLVSHCLFSHWERETNPQNPRNRHWIPSNNKALSYREISNLPTL